MNTKTQPRTLTNCPGLLSLFCGNVPGLTTCLPLICVKSCLKLLQIARSYDFANCVKSLVFANYQRTVKCWKLVQIPYGSAFGYSQMALIRCLRVFFFAFLFQPLRFGRANMFITGRWLCFFMPRGHLRKAVHNTCILSLLAFSFLHSS